MQPQALQFKWRVALSLYYSVTDLSAPQPFE
jgi:hypothetical protein